ncbi:MAG TPA: hypothetical protein VM577_01000 [Anaerovoracaceae bacterium]|nr:hypothetical protein [Anaerovoracaceae bacterium]
MMDDMTQEIIKNYPVALRLYNQDVFDEIIFIGSGDFLSFRKNDEVLFEIYGEVDENEFEYDDQGHVTEESLQLEKYVVNLLSDDLIWSAFLESDAGQEYKAILDEKQAIESAIPEEKQNNNTTRKTKI